MENLESLNNIIDELKIKPSILAIFCLDDLYAIGTGLQTSSRPTAQACSGSYELVFESKDDSFCSIFSDKSETQRNDDTLETSYEREPELKLNSESTILSSEFGCDNASTILSSDRSVNDSQGMLTSELTEE